MSKTFMVVNILREGVNQGQKKIPRQIPEDIIWVELEPYFLAGAAASSCFN